MNNEELKALINKIANKQDKASFSKIFTYFAPRLMGYLINSGSKNDIAEEITQETMTAVWQKAILFNHNKANVTTWVFTIARNKRIDRVRKNENPSYDTLDFINALYQEENYEKNEIASKIDEIQSLLNESEIKMIRMNFFEGKTHKIISRELEIPLGTVKSRMRNILIKMKK